MLSHSGREAIKAQRLEQLKPTYGQAESLGKQKKVMKYISFYGLYMTWPLLSPHLWVARLGDDMGMLQSMCKDGAACTQWLISKKQIRGIKVVKQSFA